jgi:putative oxidoreductase
MNSMEPRIAQTDQVVNTLPPAMHHDPESARQDIAAWDALHQEEREAIQKRNARVYTAGRLLMAALFLVMGFSKLAHFQGTVDFVAAAGYGDAPLLVGFVLTVEIIGGVLLALGWKVRIAAGTLIAYLITVTVLLNWDQSDAVNRALAIANFGFIGGLLFLTAHGAGGVSLERTLSRRHARSLKV